MLCCTVGWLWLQNCIAYFKISKKRFWIYLLTLIWYNTHVLRYLIVLHEYVLLCVKGKAERKEGRKKCHRAYEKYKWDRLCRSSLEMCSNCLNISLTWWEQQEGCTADKSRMWSRSVECLHFLVWGPTTGIGQGPLGDQITCFTLGPKCLLLPL